MSKINAYNFQNLIDSALEGLDYWEKTEVDVIFTSIPQLDFGTVILDTKKKILLVNTYKES
ncbi:hypothetical protein [Pseudanabaena phage PA-SR01]|nr:hypothetical protein [Pseudanabaena phage PA-SR01]